LNALAADPTQIKPGSASRTGGAGFRATPAGVALLDMVR
jgi:hypothetical protein